MHTSQPAVARLESHQHDAQLSTLARYVTALGLALHFVLTDAKTGSPVWTSLVGSTGQDLPERVRVVEDTWTKLSEDDLTPDQYVITASEEPGWSLVYEPSKKQIARLQDVTPAHSGRTETADDPRVVGFFELEDPDPVAIATAIESEGDQVHQIHTLAAKLKEPLSSANVSYGSVSYYSSELIPDLYSKLPTPDPETAYRMIALLGLTGLAHGHIAPSAEVSSAKATEVDK
jgi:hypothetical protein